MSRDGNRPASGGPAPGQREPIAVVPDPRGIRVSLAPASAHAQVPPLVVEPPAIPLAPSPVTIARGLLGGTITVEPLGSTVDAAAPSSVLVDGIPEHAVLTRQDASRVRLEAGDPPLTHRVLILDAGASGSTEVVVDGWRIEVEVESERRAALRERAARGRAESGHGGPTEVHAIIPGVVVSVSVVAGDDVTAGQQLLVVEAMKMQNELRAPRDGRIQRVAIAAGQTIEVGMLLLVIE